MESKKITYDGESLPYYANDAEEFMTEYFPIDSLAKARSFQEFGPNTEKVQEELMKLKSYIAYRQSKVDLLKEMKDNCKTKAEKDEVIEKIKKLCNGPNVGLIYLRECEAKITDLLKLCTESEKIIKLSANPPGFKTIKKDDGGSGKKLLSLIKAPQPAAPTAEEAEREQAAIEKSIEEAAERKDAKLAELIEDDKRATEFEESPDEAIHAVVEEDKKMRIHAYKLELIDMIRFKMMEVADLQAKLMRVEHSF